MNPYLLDLPAVVSFSGGRTSGFMLRQILDAHGGQPDDLKVCFQNTGLEHPATYRFVQECAERWDVDITWLEYCVTDGKHDFRVVGPCTASRNGEPFTALIRKKKYLPNPVARICTVNLKMRVLHKYLRTLPAFADGDYGNAIGLRADEPRRALKMITRGLEDGDGREVYLPMWYAPHTEGDVLRFWAESDFDLDLPGTSNHFGNCVGCYLKGIGKLQAIAQEMPEALEWWARAETLIPSTSGAGARFRNDRPTYRQLLDAVRAQGYLFETDVLPTDDSLPCMCSD